MKKLVSLMALTIALTGCSSTPKSNNGLTASDKAMAECTYFGDATIKAPMWICDPNTDSQTYISQAVGFSENTSAGVAHQKNLAMLQANKELADQVKSEIISKVKSKAGSLGVNGAGGAMAATSAEMETIANVQLNGVKILKSFKGPDGYFYVHTGLPREVLKQNVEKVISELAEQQVLPKVTAQSNKALSDEIAKALSQGE